MTVGLASRAVTISSVSLRQVMAVKFEAERFFMDSVSISPDRNDWGQIVDGLEARRATWEVTARYLEGEEVDQAIEECRDAE